MLISKLREQELLLTLSLEKEAECLFFMFTHALEAKLSKSQNALNSLFLEKAEKLNNFGSSEASFQTFKGATPGLILSKPKSDAIS